LDMKALLAFATRVICCAEEQQLRSKGSSTNVVVFSLVPRRSWSSPIKL
jgi:hypothetical protein